MRVATLFKRLLRLGRERVVAVELVEDGQERVLVDVVRPVRRRMRCPGCGFQTRATYDRAIRTWRHLDVLRTRCLLRCEVRRIECPECGVVGEEVPWARPGSRFTRAFEDTCAFLVRDAPKTVVARLMRIDWATVGRMLERVVDEALGSGEDFLDGLRRIGVDEVAYRKGHRYLLCVVDHDTGRIVWAHPGAPRPRSPCSSSRSARARPPPGGGVRRPARGLAAGHPHLRPPGRHLRRSLPRHQAGRRGPGCAPAGRLAAAQARGPRAGALVQGHALPAAPPGRGALGGRAGPHRRAPGDQRAVYRGWLLVEQLRVVYHALDPPSAAHLLAEWCEAAWHSDLEPFRKVSLTLANHSEAVINAIRLGVNNARLEAMNSTVRLISHRSRGFRRVESLIALIQLVCGKISVALPT